MQTPTTPDRAIGSATDDGPRSSPPPSSPAIGLEAAGAILGANPFAGLDAVQIAAALARFVKETAARPGAAMSATVEAARELASILKGDSTIAPHPADRRFVHPAFTENALYRRMLQVYLGACRGANRLVDDADLDWKSRERARWALSLATEALAPTNSLLGNPAALELARKTRGRSLLRGARHLLEDVRKNGAMPKQVDGSRFEIGRNVAASRGAVVFRNDVLEVIQYAPKTERVHERPFVVVPPQINKFYVIDLAPGRSFVEYATKHGLRPFVISWKNPTPAERGWDLDTYVRACREAIDAVREITGSEKVNVVGACAGGITTSVLCAHLAAAGHDVVHSVTFLVTVLDTGYEHAVSPFVTEKTVALAIHRSKSRGVLEGSEMARMFAWLRPNDLIWSYWVNNYLLGQDPPAFDILFWNADTTRLPAALHSQFLGMMVDNPLVRPNGIEVLGTPIDLGAIGADAYVVAGMTDHITPWKACFRTPELLGGNATFVLSSSGHIQSVVNPPGKKGRACFHVGGDAQRGPDGWLASSTKIDGSWWDHWVAWIRDRSGPERAAPSTLGSAAHPAMEKAPGTYVLER